MNTNDVRNMEKSQWVFWATAVPLTAVIVGLAVFVSGTMKWPRSVKPPAKPRKGVLMADLTSEDGETYVINYAIHNT